MTVAELGDRMSHLEFVRWRVYFGRKVQAQQMARGGAG